ncbi:MAG: hypothetical protein JWR09_4730 [Mucilaginibacter sp.]|nr:hypothetical protein [Mucilaginibacter sp.]
MKPFISFLRISFILLICMPAGAQIRFVNGKTITITAFESFLKKEMDSLGMPGMSIAVINNNRIVYHKALGVADIKTKIPVNDGSVFEAASMSKTAFAYFVMKMVEKRMLSLDTPLYKYMPYADIARDERYKLITARMVLCHMTGFPNWRYFEKADSSLHIKNDSLYLKFTPGTKFAYSGEGYHYLAQVIAYLNHKNLHSLDVLYQQEVSQPLGLEHFYFTGNKYIYQHKVSGHVNGKSAGRPWPQAFPDQDSTMFIAAASLHTEAVDYARFVIALMEHKGISQASLAEMLKEQVLVPEDNDLHKEGYTGWGLGIAIAQTPYGILYEHGGNNGDFQCGFQYFKNKKSGFVFMTNCDKGNEFNKKLSAFLVNGQ